MSQPESGLPPEVGTVTPLSGVEMSSDDLLTHNMTTVLAGLTPRHDTGLPNRDFHQLSTGIVSAFEGAEQLRREESHPERLDLLRNPPRVSGNGAVADDPEWDDIVERLEATNSRSGDVPRSPVSVAPGSFISVFGSLAIGSEVPQPLEDDEGLDGLIDVTIETAPATARDDTWQNLVDRAEAMSTDLGIDTQRATTENPVWQNLVGRLEATSSQSVWGSSEGFIDVTIETAPATSTDETWQELADRLDDMPSDLGRIDTQHATTENPVWQNLVGRLEAMTTELDPLAKVEEFPGWSSRRERLESMYADYRTEIAEGKWRDSYNGLFDPHVSRLQRLQELRQDLEAYNIGLNTVAITFANSEKMRPVLSWMSSENSDGNAVETAFATATDPEMRQEVWTFITKKHPVMKRFRGSLDMLPYRHVHFVRHLWNRPAADAVEAGASAMVFAALADDGAVSAKMASLVAKKELAAAQQSP
jgi:hypothetical protein